MWYNACYWCRRPLKNESHEYDCRKFCSPFCVESYKWLLRTIKAEAK